MKISKKNFPKISSEKALMIVVGVHHAKICLIDEGVVQDIAEVIVKTPQYSDREGQTQHRSSSGTMHGSGWPYERNEEHEQKTFVTALSNELKKIKLSSNNIFLFAASRTVEAVKNLISKTLSIPIQHTFVGNYTKYENHKLLAMVKKLRDKEIIRKKIIISSPDALKVLKKSEKVRKIIGKN